MLRFLTYQKSIYAVITKGSNKILHRMYLTLF